MSISSQISRLNSAKTTLKTWMQKIGISFADNASMDELVDTLSTKNLVDTSSDTVTADKMLAGTTAHDANGAQVTGGISTYPLSDGEVSDTTSDTLRWITKLETDSFLESPTIQNKGNEETDMPIFQSERQFAVVSPFNHIPLKGLFRWAINNNRIDSNGDYFKFSVSQNAAQWLRSNVVYTLDITQGNPTFVFPFGLPDFLGNDTVTPEALLTGYIAHDKNGQAITGTLQTASIIRGENEPDDSIGSDNDLYLVVEK